MSDTAAAVLQVAVLLLALGLADRPLGGYMSRVYTGESHRRVVRGLYRVMGVDPDADQRWPLRRKLEPDPARPRYLLNEPGMGYRFDPEVST